MEGDGGIDTKLYEDITRLQGNNYPEDGIEQSSQNANFLNNVDKPPLVLHISTANLRGFARFLTPSLLEGNHLLMAALCQPKPETFRKYYYALLHSCTHCDLDHFC